MLSPSFPSDLVDAGVRGVTLNGLWKVALHRVPRGGVTMGLQAMSLHQAVCLSRGAPSNLHNVPQTPAATPGDHQHPRRLNNVPKVKIKVVNGSQELFQGHLQKSSN